MTAPTTTRLCPGTLVTINHPNYPGLYEIERVKTTKAIVRKHNDPTDRGVDAPMTMLTVYTGNPGAFRQPFTGRPFQPAPNFVLGELVRFRRTGGAVTNTADIYVVVNVGPRNVSVAKLGGDHDRYIRSAPANLTRVDLADVLR